MKWLDSLARLRDRFSYYHESEQDEHRQARYKAEKLRAEQNELHIKEKLYERQLNSLLRLRGRMHTDTQTEEEIVLLKKIAQIKKKEHELHLKWHMEFHNNREDFGKYYRHINRTRPIVMIVILLLWVLLFWFGGVGTGLKIVILFFALITTGGSIMELVFLYKLKDRIMKPVENLIKGVSEITRGNYEVSIIEEGTSEISTLVRGFNEMAQKLSESERLKVEYEDNRRALIANISHDLKTPITSIQGYIEAITAGENLPAEKLDVYLKVIHSNAAYMNNLIDDLFLFAKLDMQKLGFDFEETKIVPLIEDMMEEFKLDLQEKELAFEFANMLDTDYIVKLDAKRFYQVIRNIIDNAVKHGPAEKLEIKTTLYENAGAVCLDISDNGPGISSENLPHIFERFYRADDQRTKDLSSTGLGLAIARELVHAQGGEITVTSRQNEGTCFTVSIPGRKEPEKA